MDISTRDVGAMRARPKRGNLGNRVRVEKTSDAGGTPNELRHWPGGDSLDEDAALREIEGSLQTVAKYLEKGDRGGL